MQQGEASEWGVTELIDAGGDPADTIPAAVPRSQVCVPSVRHHAALSLLRCLTWFVPPHHCALCVRSQRWTRLKHSPGGSDMWQHTYTPLPSRGHARRTARRVLGLRSGLGQWQQVAMRGLAAPRPQTKCQHTVRQCVWGLGGGGFRLAADEGADASVGHRAGSAGDRDGATDAAALREGDGDDGGGAHGGRVGRGGGREHALASAARAGRAHAILLWRGVCHLTHPHSPSHTLTHTYLLSQPCELLTVLRRRQTPPQSPAFRRPCSTLCVVMRGPCVWGGNRQHEQTGVSRVCTPVLCYQRLTRLSEQHSDWNCRGQASLCFVAVRFRSS
jgi:hypothetical protein